MADKKVNHDARRSANLAAMRAQWAKDAAAKKVADELAAKEALRAQNEVSDAKID